MLRASNTLPKLMGESTATRNKNFGILMDLTALALVSSTEDLVSFKHMDDVVMFGMTRFGNTSVNIESGLNTTTSFESVTVPSEVLDLGSAETDKGVVVVSALAYVHPSAIKVDKDPNAYIDFEEGGAPERRELASSAGVVIGKHVVSDTVAVGITRFDTGRVEPGISDTGDDSVKLILNFDCNGRPDQDWAKKPAMLIGEEETCTGGDIVRRLSCAWWDSVEETFFSSGCTIYQVDVQTAR